MTNADRIRAMSDEELAELMFDLADCYYCPNNDREEYGCSDSKERCVATWIAWLKKEATE